MKLNFKKRIFYTFIFMILLLAIIFIFIKVFSKGYVNKYKIRNKYEIKEIYTEGIKGEHNNYYIEIKANNVVFNYQLYMNSFSSSKLVKDVMYYDGNYKCLLPIFNKKINFDFVCYKNGIYYNYASIRGIDKGLDDYINKLSKKIYDFKIFEDSKNKKLSHDKIKYYNKDLLKNIILAISTINGVNIFDEEIIDIEVFNKDIYNREISTFVSNYYITADYSQKNRFKDLYVVDLLNNKQKIIKSQNYISFDSYIQGVVNNYVYLYDITNIKQYKIDINESKITEIGNELKGIQYYNNGKWETISTIKAGKKFRFIYNDKSEYPKFDYVFKEGNKLSGYYYLLKSHDNYYDVYRVSVQNRNIKKYLFSVSSVDDIYVDDDKVLYKYNEYLKYYSDETGIKTIIEYSELEYNKNIKFYLFKK